MMKAGLYFLALCSFFLNLIHRAQGCSCIRLIDLVDRQPRGRVECLIVLLDPLLYDFHRNVMLLHWRATIRPSVSHLLWRLIIVKRFRTAPLTSLHGLNRQCLRHWQLARTPWPIACALEHALVIRMENGRCLTVISSFVCKVVWVCGTGIWLICEMRMLEYCMQFFRF